MTDNDSEWMKEQLEKQWYNMIKFDLKDFKIWHRVLTSEEIDRVFNGEEIPE